MKTSMKALLIAGVMSGCSGPVLAYAPTVAPDFSFYVSGGADTVSDFLAFAQSLMLSDGNLDVYTDDSDNCGPGFQSSAVYGTWKTTTGGITAGKKVYIAYNNQFGTFASAVDALVRANSLSYDKFLNNSSHVDTCVSPPGQGVPTPFHGTAQYVLTNQITENHVPDVSLSEEELRLFTGVNLPRPGTIIPSKPLSPAELNSAQSVPLYEKAYGIAINNALSSSMMTAFGNVNLSTAQMSAILAGTYNDWSQVCQINPSGTSVCLPAGPITFFVAAPGNGIKAAFNEYFLNNPGSTGFAGTNVAPVDQAGTQGDCVNLPKTTYNVCGASTNLFMKRGLNIAASKGTRAVGMLPLETVLVGSVDSIEFANLDGVEIIRATSKSCSTSELAFDPARIVNGDYRLFYTYAVNTRAQSVAGAHFLGDGSVNSQFMSAFSSTAANPFLEITIPGVLLDPSVVGGPSGFATDKCITKASHMNDSTGPLYNLF